METYIQGIPNDFKSGMTYAVKEKIKSVQKNGCNIRKILQ